MTIKFFSCPSVGDCMRVVENATGTSVAFVSNGENNTLAFSNHDISSDWRFTRHRLDSTGEDLIHVVSGLKLYKFSIHVPINQFIGIVSDLGYKIKSVTVPAKTAIEY